MTNEFKAVLLILASFLSGMMATSITSQFAANERKNSESLTTSHSAESKKFASSESKSQPSIHKSPVGYVTQLR